VLTVCGWVRGGRTTVGGDADADGEAVRHEGKSSGRLPDGMMGGDGVYRELNW
jgi:hypothetical protein